MLVAVDDKAAEIKHVMEDSLRKELPSVLKVIQEAKQTQLSTTIPGMRTSIIHLQRSDPSSMSRRTR